MEKIELNNGTVIKPEDIMNIARSAGKKILKIYEGEIEVEDKISPEYEEGVSPLTKADLESNEEICSNLNKIFPNIPLLSEENKEVSFQERASWEYFWLVDPLDGTKEFIKKNGEFTVNIALIKNNKPILGVVYAPVKDTFYYGDFHNGSFKKIRDEEPHKLENMHEAKKRVRVVASKSHFNQETKGFIDSLKEEFSEVELINAGSSLKLCFVAEGKADIYPRLGPTMEWDTAAAHAVVKFSGKNVYNYGDKKELEYNKENLLNPYFIVK